MRPSQWADLFLYECSKLTVPIRSFSRLWPVTQMAERRSGLR
jgi:hypothetical protein